MSSRKIPFHKLEKGQEFVVASCGRERGGREYEFAAIHIVSQVWMSKKHTCDVWKYLAGCCLG